MRAGRAVEADVVYAVGTKEGRPPMTPSRFPVLEVAVLDVRRGHAAAFREAFARADGIIASMPGYGGHELRACVENDHRFLLLVWWDSVESHERGFRGSPQYAEWKRLLHHFYDPFPRVEHYVPT